MSGKWLTVMSGEEEEEEEGAGERESAQGDERGSKNGIGSRVWSGRR